MAEASEQTLISPSFLPPKGGAGQKLTFYTHDVYNNRLPHPIKLTPAIHEHISKIPHWIKYEYDYPILCTGYPGVGKSHVIQRLAVLLNASFSLNDIVFTPTQLETWIDTAEPGSVCIFDEADAAAEHHASAILRSMKRHSKRIRLKRLIIFYVTPTLSDMNKYFLWRAKMLIYCFLGSNKNPWDRGYINIYHNSDLILDLYAVLKDKGERERYYHACRSTLKNQYIGIVTKEELAEYGGWFIDKNAYEDKKESARLDAENGADVKNTFNYKAGRNDIVKSFYEKSNYTQEQIAVMMGVTQQTVQRIVKGVKKIDQ